MKKHVLSLLALAAAQTSLCAHAAAPQAHYTWRNVTILAGGFIPGIVFSPAQKGLVYVRTDIGGFYRSDDAGQRWTPLTDSFGDDHGNWLGGESIAPDPRDPQTVYAAAGMYSSNPAAMLRSYDQGRTWQATPVPIKMGGNEDGRGCGERLAVDPGNTKVLYFGSRYDGLWKSTDGSATWSRVDSFPSVPTGVVGDWRNPGQGISFILFDPKTATDAGCKTLYAGVSAAGASSALYRSTDAGASWQPLAGLPAGLVAHHGALDTDGTLYVTLGHGAGPNGVSDGAVFKFNTASGTWTDITPDKPTKDHGFGYAGLSLDLHHPGRLVVTTADRWYPGDDVFLTENAGQSWHPIKPTWHADVALTPYLNWGDPQPREGWWMDAVAIDPSDSNHVMYGTGATIYGTHDVDHALAGQPTHWAPEVQGLEETAAICLISPPAGAHLISGLGDVCGFVHDDFSISPPQGMMNNPIDNNTYGLDFSQRQPNLIVRVGEKGGTMSRDGGQSWTPFAHQQGRGNEQSIAIAADGRSIVWLTRSGGHVSTDGGKTWNPSAGLPARATVVADRINPARFYALADGALLQSTDGGRSFASFADHLPLHGSDLRNRLVASPATEGDLWLTADDGLLHLNPSAQVQRVSSVQSAKLVALGMPAPGHSTPVVYLAGRVDGKSSIYRSDDDGGSWTRLEDDTHQFGWLPDALAADPRVYGRVYLGTNGRGVLYGEPAAGDNHP